MPKVMPQFHARHFGEFAGHLNPHGSPTDKRECKLAANFLISGMFNRSHLLRSLERAENFGADEVGIIERFKAWSATPPFVVPEIVIPDARREDKEVVRQVIPGEMNNPLGRVDSRDFIQEHIDVFLMTKDGAQGFGDFISKPAAT
jgi:hypothetical protein